jgi:hypothetical protein
LVSLAADFFAGAFISTAETDTFLTAGVLVFLGSAIAAEGFLSATFFALAVAADLAGFGEPETALLVLAPVLAPAAFLEADFVSCFTIMSPLLMPELEIGNPVASNDIDANLASQQIATNI